MPSRMDYRHYIYIYPPILDWRFERNLIHYRTFHHKDSLITYHQYAWWTPTLWHVPVSFKSQDLYTTDPVIIIAHPARRLKSITKKVNLTSLSRSPVSLPVIPLQSITNNVSVWIRGYYTSRKDGEDYPTYCAPASAGPRRDRQAPQAKLRSRNQKPGSHKPPGPVRESQYPWRFAVPADESESVPVRTSQPLSEVNESLS